MQHFAANIHNFLHCYGAQWLILTKKKQQLWFKQVLLCTSIRYTLQVTEEAVSKPLLSCLLCITYHHSNTSSDKNNLHITIQTSLLTRTIYTSPFKHLLWQEQTTHHHSNTSFENNNLIFIIKASLQMSSTGPNLSIGYTGLSFLSLHTSRGQVIESSCLIQSVASLLCINRHVRVVESSTICYWGILFYSIIGPVCVSDQEDQSCNVVTSW